MAKNCSDCYDGCTQITTDKCIRYTGIDNNVLGIKTGDSLSYVEQALITFLSSVLDGTGIKLDISEDILCELVSQYIPECEDLTALDLFNALIQAACSLQEQLDAQKARIDVIEADYDVDCLEEVSAGDGTHIILQAVITKLCETSTALTALAEDLDTNYVKLADLNDLIQAYLDSIAVSTKFYNRMVPYCPIPYMGSLTGFDITGAGSGDWEQIYLCNGLNGTPDLRGRIIVGAIQNMGGGALDPAVDPASDPTYNPNYGLGDTAYGVNSVTLTTPQIPTHTHTATVNEEPHTHTLATEEDSSVDLASSVYMSSTGSSSSANDYVLKGTVNIADIGQVGEAETGITVTNSDTGGGEAHDNKQPSLATYFIIYLPS